MAATTWLDESPNFPLSGATITILVVTVVAIVAVKAGKRLWGKKKKLKAAPPPPPPAPLITEREKQRLAAERKEAEKARAAERKAKKQQAARLFRMAPALGLIIFSIAIGWTNLVDFFVEGASVPTRVAYGSVFVFVVGTLWAGYERYRASGEAQTKTSFTMLLWALIALEGGVQFLHGLLFNPAVEWHGALFLAIMSPLAGVVFELAIAANRSEAKSDLEGQSNRQIPGSYKKNPMLYLRLLHTKNTNPEWTTPEIVSHVRALDTTKAIRAYNRAMERPKRMRKIFGTRRHLDRITRTMIALNPHGAPPRDGRMTLARQLNLENSAREIAESGGDMYQILTTLGVRAEIARKALGLRAPKHTRYTSPEGVQTEPDKGVQNTPTEGVQNPPSEGVQIDPDPSVQLTPDPSVQNLDPLAGLDMDAELAKLLGEHPSQPDPGVQTDPAKSVQSSTDTDQEVFNTPPSKSVQNTSKTVRPTEESNTPTKPTKPKQETTRPAGRKPAKTTRSAKAPTAPKNRKATADEQVNQVYGMVVEARKVGRPDPSTRQVAADLGVAVGTAAARLNKAKEEAEKNGFRAVN